MPFEKINDTNTYNAWDYSGNGNNASEFGGATWNSTGGFDGNGSYEFDGSTGYLTIPNTVIFDANNLTLSLWFRPRSTYSSGGGRQDLISRTWGPYLFLGAQSDSGELSLLLYDDANAEHWVTSTTKTWDSGTWYNIVVERNSTDMLMYVNGVLENKTSISPFAVQSGTTDLFLGRKSWASDSFFDGTLDEINFFNRSLSSEQILAIYNNQTDLLVSQETSVGNNWTIDVTPNDGTEDGSTVRSNSLLILESTNNLPSAPVLLLPINKSTTTNRTPGFTWNNSIDSDDDPISYHLIIDDDITFNNPEINISAITNTTSDNTTYILNTALTTDTTYYWKVRANDSTGYGDFSGVHNFTLNSLLSIDIINSIIEFGSITPGSSLNTTDGSPSPFRLENSGNIKTNITITGTQLLNTSDFPSSDFQFSMAENESGSFNTTLSTTTWTNIDSSSSSYDIVNLDWQNHKDDFLCHLNLTVQSAEPAGVKSSTITFTVVANE